ncbi:hypothetical protein OW492_00440 [Psychromonas sp. 14N.309.X.WAT.B.A12]|uniref:hypothetical protein n=1 Tax=Psychromonas sp. 14N.309.X.WAT.B.A12 TaxID=2998322 RepID=UPI0025B11231|nr:hypothetical protein [Psychromonas sp. 14N.309.X.WAT.B.A12]MDN2661839.1 hypothetical protein [Psychromonas sp. 14N.309.X.WAT.B.A12]
MIRVLLVVIAVMSVACLALWWRVDHLSSNNQILTDKASQYEKTIEANERALLALKASFIKQDNLLVKQQQSNQSLYVALKHKQRELTKLSESNENIKNWANELIPSDVNRLLIDKAESDN